MEVIFFIVTQLKEIDTFSSDFAETFFFTFRRSLAVFRINTFFQAKVIGLLNRALMEVSCNHDYEESASFLKYI